LISLGGKTTPAGALISSNPPKMSPSVADGAIMHGYVEFLLWCGGGDVERPAQHLEVFLRDAKKIAAKGVALPSLASRRMHHDR
jgi:hypothetical protein